MNPRVISIFFTAAVMGSGLVMLSSAFARSETTVLPNPKLDNKPTAMTQQTAVFAGGCFWGIEAVFEHVNGVLRVDSGYAGGTAASANYRQVSAGQSQHAESVKISYDPNKISYGTLLKIFFSVAHDPTQLNRQGPDTGTQYRSAIFYGDKTQQAIAAAYITQLGQAKSFTRPIVTQLAPLQKFYPAESYHQDYARLNPNAPYIVYHDAPKVAALKAMFPEFYQAQ